MLSGPGIARRDAPVDLPTSHADLLPTLLSLADVDVEAAQAALGRTHTEVQPLVGRDLSGLLTGRTGEAELDAPIYFMTEDQMSRGYQDPVRRAVDSWLDSRSHRKAMLTPEFLETGVGVALAADGTLYFTQLFVLRNTPPPGDAEPSSP